MPVEASRKKSFSFKHRAKRVENNNPKNSYALDKNAWCPFTGGGAFDASEKSFSASLDASRQKALLGFNQAAGLAGGHDFV